MSKATLEQNDGYGSSDDQLIDQSKDFLTVVIAEQVFAIPILQVQDVLGKQSVTKVPLAPPEIAGSLNLRGRIVTAINVRSRLGLPSVQEDDSEEEQTEMSVVVEHGEELYSLIIDRVGDVLTLKDKYVEKTPATLDRKWRDISSGIYRMEDGLIVILDVSKFLETVHD